jgi:hypothetical protein
MLWLFRFKRILHVAGMGGYDYDPVTRHHGSALSDLYVD